MEKAFVERRRLFGSASSKHHTKSHVFRIRVSRRRYSVSRGRFEHVLRFERKVDEVLGWEDCASTRLLLSSQELTFGRGSYLSSNDTRQYLFKLTLKNPIVFDPKKVKFDCTAGGN